MLRQNNTKMSYDGSALFSAVFYVVIFGDTDARTGRRALSYTRSVYSPASDT